jgi:hypothetical protein
MKSSVVWLRFALASAFHECGQQGERGLCGLGGPVVLVGQVGDPTGIYGGRRPARLVGPIAGAPRQPDARVVTSTTSGMRSAAQWQRPQPSERLRQRACPGPAARQPHDQAAGMADHAGGHMPQPIPQRLGLGDA